MQNQKLANTYFLPAELAVGRRGTKPPVVKSTNATLLFRVVATQRGPPSTCKVIGLDLVYFIRISNF